MSDVSALSETSDSTVIDLNHTGPVARRQNSPFVVVIYPRESHIHFQLSATPIVVGRGGDVTLVDERISRRHCEISLVGQKVIVKDLGSTNGTFIDGKKISQAELTVNSRLQLGKVVLKLDYKDLAEIRYEEELYRAATLDSLTNAYNRSAFMRQANKELAYAQRAESSLSIILCDIDFFKRVNDTYGHPAGDQILREVADVIHTEKRETDLFGRFGGEEFILLLRGEGVLQAEAFAERIRAAIAAHRFHYKEQQIPITLSLGVKHFVGGHAWSLDELIEQADKALYESKRAGRNRVSIGL